MPASLHRDLAWTALAENVSLNQFICATLAGAIAWDASDSEGEAIGRRRNVLRGEDAVADMWARKLAGG
jgi:hypothetical protein